MAALVVEETIDLNGLHKHLERELPAYARPLFLRVQSEISATSTFKQRKLELVDEGFDPRRVKEPLFFDHPKLHGYVPLTEQILRDIEAGEVRL
jgi:fatty-acyl-CoA synthase